MTRYIEQTAQPPKVKAENPKPVQKYGGTDGRKDYSGLYESKKIPTKGGYK